MHTFLAFATYAPDIEIILVLNKSDKFRWETILEKEKIDIPHHIIYGGNERFFSVKNVLDYFPFEENALIGIHDIVRPFVAEKTIREAYEAASIYGASAPAINATNTIRISNGADSYAMDRRHVKVVQNPQVFKREILISAFKQEYQEDFFDDATVVERNGQKIHLTQGNYENIKITYPLDLHLAEAILTNQPQSAVYENV